LFVGTALTFKWYLPALVIILVGWPIGAAITHYDNYGTEILIARLRMPTYLKVT
jgi:hypothetical protein